MGVGMAAAAAAGTGTVAGAGIGTGFLACVFAPPSFFGWVALVPAKSVSQSVSQSVKE